MLFSKYPETNFHELNLDWIIAQVEDAQGAIPEIERLLDEVKKEVDESKRNAMIAELYASIAEKFATKAFRRSSYNLERKGSRFIDASVTDECVMQGACMVNDSDIVAYFCSNADMYSMGTLRRINVDNGVVSAERIHAPFGHGQSLAFDGENIFILHYHRDTSDYVNQKISVIKADTLTDVAVNKTITLNVPDMSIWAIAYDDVRKKLYCAGTQPNNYTHLIVTELIFDGSTFKTSEDYISYVKTDTVPYIDIAFDAGNMYAVTFNDSNITTWDKLSGELLNVASLPETFTDNMRIGEIESVSLLDGGRCYMTFVAVANQTVSGSVEHSGLYAYHVGYTNLYTNVANYNPRESQIGANRINYINVDNSVDYWNADGRSKPFSSIYLALMVDAGVTPIKINISEHDTEHVNNLVINGKTNFRITCVQGCQFKADHIFINDSSAVMKGFVCDDFACRLSDVKIINGTIPKLIAESSNVVTNVRHTSEINADKESHIYSLVNQPNVFTGMYAGCRMYQQFAGTVTSKGIDTGLIQNKFDGAAMAGLFVNANSHYIRINFPTNSGDLRIPFIDATATGFVHIKVDSTDKHFYITELSLSDGTALNNIAASGNAVIIY